MGELRAALEELERAWTAAGDTYLSARLGPGLTPEEILAATAHLPLTLHDDVITWFGWHACSQGVGSRIGGSAMHAVSIEAAVVSYEANHLIAHELARDLGWSEAQAGWAPHWFPICQTLGGDTLAVGCESFPDGSAPVYVRHKEFEGAETPIAASLLVVVREWIDSYRNGAYTWDGERWVEDFSKIPQWRLSSGLW